jgi:hypothetical protein
MQKMRVSKVSKDECTDVEIIVCGNGGVVRFDFRPNCLTRGIVASPICARKFADRILAAVEEAEEYNQGVSKDVS